MEPDVDELPARQLLQEDAPSRLNVLVPHAEVFSAPGKENGGTEGGPGTKSMTADCIGLATKTVCMNACAQRTYECSRPCPYQAGRCRRCKL